MVFSRIKRLPSYRDFFPQACQALRESKNDLKQLQMIGAKAIRKPNVAKPGPTALPSKNSSMVSKGLGTRRHCSPGDPATFSATSTIPNNI